MSANARDPESHVSASDLQSKPAAFKRPHQFELCLPRSDPAELARAKAAAKLAFVAYETAVREGDTEHADAARQRFLAASERLKGGCHG